MRTTSPRNIAQFAYSSPICCSNVWHESIIAAFSGVQAGTSPHERRTIAAAIIAIPTQSRVTEPLRRRPSFITRRRPVVMSHLSVAIMLRSIIGPNRKSIGRHRIRSRLALCVVGKRAVDASKRPSKDGLFADDRHEVLAVGALSSGWRCRVVPCRHWAQRWCEARCEASARSCLQWW